MALKSVFIFVGFFYKMYIRIKNEKMKEKNTEFLVVY